MAKSWADGCVLWFNIVLSLVLISVASWGCGWGGFVFGVVLSLFLFGVTNREEVRYPGRNEPLEDDEK